MFGPPELRFSLLWQWHHACRGRTLCTVAAAARDVTPQRRTPSMPQLPYRGAGELLVTSIDKDGTRRGLDLELLRAITAAVTARTAAPCGHPIPIRASLCLCARATTPASACSFREGAHSCACVCACRVCARGRARPVASVSADGRLSRHTRRPKSAAHVAVYRISVTLHSSGARQTSLPSTHTLQHCAVL